MPMIQCPDCQQEISDTARACPNCGRRQKRPLPMWLKGTFAVLLILATVIIYQMGQPKRHQPATELTAAQIVLLCVDLIRQSGYGCYRIVSVEQVNATAQTALIIAQERKDSGTSGFLIDFQSGKATRKW